MLTARESNLGAEARDQSPEVRHSESQYSPLLEARLDGGERAAETPWRWTQSESNLSLQQIRW